MDAAVAAQQRNAGAAPGQYQERDASRWRLGRHGAYFPRLLGWRLRKMMARWGMPYRKNIRRSTS